MEERLQKFLASAGVASRRKAEELILQGRVKVNAAVVVKLGSKVDPARDLVTVDGKLVSSPTSRAYYLLYKPPGCVTTASDPEGRPTALEYLRGVEERVFPVGRLDWDAEGAILFTDDGELANRLAHPRYGHRRVYLVKVKGDPEPEALRRMAAGVRLEDGPAQALEVAVHERAEKNVWIRVVVAEGRFHLVKRLCEAVGLQVQRLFRPEFGGVTVEGLRPGTFRALSPVEVRAMKHSVGLAPGELAALPRALPKAARRHGHGPPAPPPPRETDELPRGERRPLAERPDPRELPGRQDRRERPERKDRGERPPSAEHRGPRDRRESPGRPDRRERPEWKGRGERTPPAERGGPRDRREFPGRPDRRERPEWKSRGGRPEPAERRGSQDSRDFPRRPDRPERKNRGERTPQPARGGRGGPPGRAGPGGPGGRPPRARRR